MDRFIGADRHGRSEIFKKFVLAGRHRLLEQGNLFLDKHTLHGIQQVEVPAFVGVDDQDGARGRFADGADLGFRVAGIDLHLQDRHVSCGHRRVGHRSRHVECDRQSGRNRSDRLPPDHLLDVAAREPGFQIP